MAEQAVMKTYNHDVAGIHRRCNRFLIEIIKSVSSGVSQMNEFDIERLKTYTGALKTYHAWVVGQPHLDLPETHPRMYVMEPNPDIPDVENESIGDLMHMIMIARDEMMNCQSSRLGSGFIAFDSKRFLAVVAKIEAFVEAYVEIATPLDLPESSPSEELTGPGLGGV